MTTPITLPSEAETQELRRAFEVLWTCATPEARARMESRLADPHFHMIKGSIFNDRRWNDANLCYEDAPSACLLGLLLPEANRQVAINLTRLRSGQTLVRYTNQTWKQLVSRACVQERVHKKQPSGEQRYFYTIWDGFCSAFSPEVGKQVLVDHLTRIKSTPELTASQGQENDVLLRPDM